jgi:hypothetical protein
MKFTIDGKTADMLGCVDRMQQACLALKDGELITMKRMSEILQVPFNTAHGASKNAKVSKFTAANKSTRSRVFGNEKTIVEYKKLVQ